MPKPYPREFRDDVVAMARRRAQGVTIDQISADFDITHKQHSLPKPNLSPQAAAVPNVYGRYDLHAIKTPKTGQYRPLRNT